MPVKSHLVRVALAGALSPAQAFSALADEPHPFALSGAWAGGGAIVGSDPIRIAGEHEDPFTLLGEQPPVDGSAAPAGTVGGGWFGWLGYRLAARVERVALAPCRPVALPDFQLAYYDNVLRCDRRARWWFEALCTPEREAPLAARLARVQKRLRTHDRVPVGIGGGGLGPLCLSGVDANHHLDAVADCRRRIAAGEIFQANICLRLEADFAGTPAQLLRNALDRPDALGGLAPPYAAAFQTPRGGIVSLSPELFLRRRGRDVVTGPIKGTIARHGDAWRAAAARERLQASAKDAAEHVMIVDLMRNDLGRVCEYGSVRAPRRPRAEAHPGLWHLVSRVRGRLRDGVGDGDLLRATFPPGSVTGAPKVQSLQVIAALEPTGREVYTGAIGMASPLAGLELSVAIRTLELGDGRLWLGAGGGIVADSDPRRELAEALAKAAPIAAAAGSEVVVERAAERASVGGGRGSVAGRAA